MDDRATELRVIGVAYDGSPESHAALEVAAELARDAGATVQVIGVYDRTAVPAPVAMSSMYAVPASDEQCRDELYRRLEAAADSLPAETRPAIVLLNGDPAEQLAKQSARLSLLVIGTHGYGPVRRMLLGSVSKQVRSAAECPVLTVPRRSADDCAAA